ncbi:MAG: threonine aldolase [Bacteroidetes bacterium]|jgi:threonine aldolase|nr:threonine aldolase [Bacteroidota bacterium]MCA6443999.1 threonine aldolase [Bacteroidota bacterium]
MLIDLRSDTVTKPGEGMLKAIQAAKVGDDVFSEDETVNQLQSYAANLFGKEAALFCPSGTMTNQIAIKVHTQPGDELLCDVNSHIYNYEGGGISFNSGVQAKLLKGVEGKLNAELVEENINGNFDWLTKTSLVCLENTVNRAGGSIYELNEIKPIAELCKIKKLKLHLDGARLFNALIETGDTAKDIGNSFDSISICLSKGLGAPVGSLLIGDADFIQQARRIRKVFGGGMRQAGFIAAAGLYALENNVKRLKEDHKKAKELEAVLKSCNYVKDVLNVYTNIVIFNLRPEMYSGSEFEARLAKSNIKIAAFGKNTIRMVTHLDYTDQMHEMVIKVLQGLN